MNYLYDRTDGLQIHGIHEKDGVLYQKQVEYYDTVVNVSDNGEVEVLHFKRPFSVPKYIAMDEDMASNYRTNCEFAQAMSTQKWKSVDGVVTAVSSDVRIADLVRSRAKASKESKKKFYNYALANNNWQYFCTWTFADGEIRNDKDLLYKTYNEFVKTQRKSNPDIKVLAVYEEFEKGGYHMHALVGDCTLKLTPALNKHTGQFMYSKFNHQIFNCYEWKHGWSTAVCIVPTSIKQQVVNYLGKYLTKNCPAPYRCKRFFHTLNLDCRDTFMINMSDDNDPVVKAFASNNSNKAKNFKQFAESFGLEKKKNTKDERIEIYSANVTVGEYLQENNARKVVY